MMCTARKLRDRMSRAQRGFLSLCLTEEQSPRGILVRASLETSQSCIPEEAEGKIYYVIFISSIKYLGTTQIIIFPLFFLWTRM